MKVLKPQRLGLVHRTFELGGKYVCVVTVTGSNGPVVSLTVVVSSCCGAAGVGVGSGVEAGVGAGVGAGPDVAIGWATPALTELAQSVLPAGHVCDEATAGWAVATASTISKL